MTMKPEDFKMLLKANRTPDMPKRTNSDASFYVGKVGDFLLRAQLDCYHPDLPNKTFDLKTRAILPIRYDMENYMNNLHYVITRQKGVFGSFEREYYDMIRAPFLKFSFQVRIGKMDGIMVAYHNTREMFGFEYVPAEDIDLHVFGSTTFADQSFNMSLKVLDKLLHRAIALVPDHVCFLLM